MEKETFELAISDINSKIAKLAQNIEQLNVNVNNIAQQQSESHVQAHQADDSGSGHLENRRPEGINDNLFSIRESTASGQGPVDPSPPADNASAYSGASFDQVRDKYSRHTLPQHLKVHDPAAGIKNECKPALKILSKSARFTETALKIISDLCPQHIPIENQEINDLVSVLTAQINFLQSEYSGLVVRSTFDEETSRLFRSLESNSSAFSERSLSNVRVAAELAAIAGRNSRGAQRASRGGRGSSRGHGYSNRGFYNSSSSYSNNRFRGGGGAFPERPNGDTQSS